MSYRLLSPYIRWGATHQNAAYFGFPVDNVTAWSEPRQGSEFIQYPSAVEDAWLLGGNFDQVLEGDLRWIPGSDTLFSSYPRATGWDFNTNTPGIRQFLEWARQKNQFTWVPDGRNLLLYPKLTIATIDYAVSSSGAAGWTSAAGPGTTGVSVSFDAGTGAWKIVGSNPSGSPSYVQMWQYFPAIAGETFSFSADYQVTGLAGGAYAELFTQATDQTLAVLATLSDVTNLTATSFTRAGGGSFGTAAPSGTVYVFAYLKLFLPATTGAGTVWFRNAMVRRDSTVATFIDNSYVLEPYLVDPQVVPACETDGTRKLHIKMRQTALDWLGY